MGMFFKELWLEWPALVRGVEWTLILSVAITLSGLLGGILLQYCLTHASRTLRVSANGFVTFFIATPLLALLFLMYYGLPTIGLGMPPFAAAFIGFTVNVAAYNSRYLMSGYKAIAPAELTAATAMGFSRRQIYLSLILPQSLRYAVPGLTNQAINNLKDTSIAFLIQCDGFLSFIQNFTSQNFFFFQGYAFAAFGYLLMVILLTLVARKIQSLTRIPGFE